MAKSAGKVTLPLKVGRAKVPISLEVTVSKTRPRGAKNVTKVTLGGEEFYIGAGKTVLA